MIPKKEIFSKAEQLNIPISTIEKDYVIIPKKLQKSAFAFPCLAIFPILSIGPIHSNRACFEVRKSSGQSLANFRFLKFLGYSWVLAGIYHYPSFEKFWIFKGGTCLKKCYFGNYRFSEDLDFTISDPQVLNLESLKNAFMDIAEYIEERSGIKIIRSTIRFESYKNLNGKISFQGKLNYRGPLQPHTNFPKIKIDLIAEEILVSSPSFRKILHDFSDQLPTEFASCYSFEEIFAEKIRALVERARPRDLYDVIHLHNMKTFSINSIEFLNILRKKCKYKNVSFPSLATLENHPNFGNLKSEWNNMLKHQLPQLEPFSHYWNRLSEVLEVLNS